MFETQAKEGAKAKGVCRHHSINPPRWKIALDAGAYRGYAASSMNTGGRPSKCHSHTLNWLVGVYVPRLGLVVGFDGGTFPSTILPPALARQTSTIQLYAAADGFLQQIAARG